MYHIKVDLPEIPAVVENALNQVMRNISAAVEQTAAEAQTAWQSGIWRTQGVWLEHKQRAIGSIQMQMMTPNSAQIWSEDPITKRIEEGFPQRDLKDMLNTSDKVRESKSGKKYLYIPFRHNIPGESAHGQSMPNHVYAEAKQLAPSMVTGMGRRLSATGANVKQARYHWGGRLGAGLTAKKKPFHSTDIHAGMVKMKTTAMSKGGYSMHNSHAYMTFRTMVEGSPKWLVPAQPGHYVLKTLSQMIVKRFESNLKNAIQQALS